MGGKLSMDYQEAFKSLGDKSSKKIAPNTILIADCIGDKHFIAIRFYSTNIITFYPDGMVRLSSGGHQTVTTKDRINSYNKEGILYNRKGVWYFEYRDIHYIFRDGMCLYPDGTSSVERVEVYDLNSAGCSVTTYEEALDLIRGSTTEALEVLWKKCKRIREFIAYYASLEFIPLIINYGYKRDSSWFDTAKLRLEKGE
jgi:hypothetical protein